MQLSWHLNPGPATSRILSGHSDLFELENREELAFVWLHNESPLASVPIVASGPLFRSPKGI